MKHFVLLAFLVAYDVADTWTAFDARVITFSGDYAISSPNMTYIPSYIFGSAKLVTRQDGRWGYLDPFQTPQELSPTFIWAAVIPRKGTENSLTLLRIWTDTEHRHVARRRLHQQWIPLANSLGQ